MIRKHSVNYPDPVKHGISVSEEAKDLINKLLDKDPVTRLGSNGGLDEILAHKWFNDLDRDQIQKKVLKSPYVPKV